MTTVQAGPRWRDDGKYLSARVDFQGVAFLEDRSSLTLKVNDLYLASSQRLSDRHQVFLGRRHLPVSLADDFWSLGVWNPRFVWDPLRPEVAGLTGAFYEYSREAFSFGVFASPLAIPDMGYPVSTVAGDLKTSSPWFVPPPEQVHLGETEIDLQYQIATPSASSILLRSGALAQATVGESQGPFARVSYGYLPANQADVAAEVGLRARDLVLETKLVPSFGWHQVGTVETGWRKDRWHLWASGTRDLPQQIKAPETSYWRPMSAAWIAATGAGVKPWMAAPYFFVGYLRVFEDSPHLPVTGPVPSLALSLPSRFAFERAVRAGARWDELGPVQSSVSVTRDLGNQADLISLDFGYLTDWAATATSPGVRLGLGADIISAGNGAGWIGQYRGNDRARGSVTYEF